MGSERRLFTRHTAVAVQNTGKLSFRSVRQPGVKEIRSQVPGTVEELIDKL